jgi:hypothetical protein
MMSEIVRFEVSLGVVDEVSAKEGILTIRSKLGEVHVNTADVIAWHIESGAPVLVPILTRRSVVYLLRLDTMAGAQQLCADINKFVTWREPEERMAQPRFRERSQRFVRKKRPEGIDALNEED